MENLQKRTEQLIVQQVGLEALVYDERSHQAFCLDSNTAAVWQSCNGIGRSRALQTAAAELALNPEETGRILEALEERGLVSVDRTAAKIQQTPLLQGTPFTRRAVVARLATGAVMAVPIIAAIVAPPAAQAYSGCTIGVGGVCITTHSTAQRAAGRRSAGADAEGSSAEETGGHTNFFNP